MKGIDIKHGSSLVAHEIRSCRDCNPASKPCVYVGQKPSIVVVSDGPPETEFRDALGDDWTQGERIFGAKTSGKLVEWVGIQPDEAIERIVWIHARNCWIGKDLADMAIANCEGHRYIERMIEAVDPKFVIVLGGVAAQRLGFLRVGSLTHNLGIHKKERPYILLYHPSWTASKYHQNPEHKAALEQLKQLVGEVTT